MKYFVFNHHNFWQWPPSNSDLMEAEVVFMWADWPFKDRVRQLQGLGKKIVVYEHGFGALWDYELNKREPCANGFISLGEASKGSLIRKGVEPSKILVTGNPVFDDIEKSTHGKKRALYVALHWVGDRTEYNQVVYDQLREAYPDLEWTVKLIDKSGDIQAERKWFNRVESQDILADIKAKLPSYDLVFTPKPSTFESFARLMGIPVYVVDEKETFRADNEPRSLPMNNTYLKIGEDLPDIKEIDMTEHIKRPSTDIEEIVEWAIKL